MLARQSLVRAASRAATTTGAAPSGARNMATLREIELRLKSVRNIEKITKACLLLSPGPGNADNYLRNFVNSP